LEWVVARGGVLFSEWRTTEGNLNGVVVRSGWLLGVVLYLASGEQRKENLNGVVVRSVAVVRSGRV
jgi:hypothetical protein